MNKLQTRVKIALLWLLPIVYEVWYKILDIFPREIRTIEKGAETISDNKGIDIFIDIMIFFRAYHILYFFLYIAIISAFKSTYKFTTFIFFIFQVISLILINSIYPHPQSIIELGYSMCYFAPFYLIVYILIKEEV